MTYFAQITALGRRGRLSKRRQSGEVNDTDDLLAAVVPDWPWS